MSLTEAAPRFATPRNPNRLTLGRKVGKVMAAIDPPRRLDGLRGPMPWQQDALDVACEIDPATGGFWYREVVVIVPRQAGKTSMSRGKITHRCITTPLAPVLYTAQDRNMARRRLEKSFLEPLSASPLAALLAPAQAGRGGKLGWDGANGREKVKFANKSEIFIIAAQKKTAGHGDTLPEAHLDEYFAQVDGRLEQAIGPTMITVPGSQRWVTSAAGDATSAPLWAKVEAGRARVRESVESRTCYIEYSAPEDADRTDPDAIRACHPAVGFTIDVEDVLAEQVNMDANGPAEWNRAYFGWWPSATERPWVIPKASWLERRVEPVDVDWTGEPVWSLDISPERDAASIGLAAAARSGRVWLEVVAHEDGETWLVPHLRKLRSMFGGSHVALDGSGPAAALVPELEAEGFTVHRLGMRQKVDACGALYRAALAATIEHGGDPTLDGALAGAAKRTTSGDAFLWVRGTSLVDITPLYVITLARWLFVDLADDDYDPAESAY